MQCGVPQISQLNFLIHAECAFECILGGFASKHVSNLSILKKKQNTHTATPDKNLWHTFETASSKLTVLQIFYIGVF